MIVTRTAMIIVTMIASSKYTTAIVVIGIAARIVVMCSSTKKAIITSINHITIEAVGVRNFLLGIARTGIVRRRMTTTIKREDSQN